MDCIKNLKELGCFIHKRIFHHMTILTVGLLKQMNTYAMHYFYKSWLPPKARFKSNVKMIAAKMIGGDNIARIRKTLGSNRS